MQTLTILTTLLLALPSLAQAGACAGDKSDKGHCDILDWRGNTNDSSPLVGGCEDTCRSILTDAGDWTVNLTGAAEGERRTLFAGHACSFAVGREHGQKDPLAFDMANQDILDAMDGVISKFSKNGHAAGQGEMKCEGKMVHFWVD